MKLRNDTKILYVCIISWFLFFACGKSKTPEENILKGREIEDLTSMAEEYADSILSGLTLEERVGQCLMPSVNSTADSLSIRYLKKLIEDFHVGGIVLHHGDTASVKKLSKIASFTRIPLFIAIDAEWGLGMRLKDAPVFPKNGELDKESTETVLFDYGREIAFESRRLGINMILGPVVDITDKTSGVIGKRSFGNNPEFVAAMGVAYAKGLESGGVISVAKHFPGHGKAINDSHRSAADLTRNISTLDSVELKPFREYIEAGLTGIMAGHIRALTLDPEGNAASVSMDMLSLLLREEMGFKGLILTDAFNMGGAKGFSAADALRAGADIILCPENINIEYQNILEKVKSGELNLSVINDHCHRILFYKALMIH